MSAPARLRRHHLLLGLAGALLACDASTANLLADGAAAPPSETVAGGPCERDTDCAYGSLCLIDEHFPGGACAVPCHDSTTCPQDTVCIRIDDRPDLAVHSACLKICAGSEQCRSGFECREQETVAPGAVARVCIAD